MVNVKSMLARRDKKIEKANSLRKDGVNPDSSKRPLAKTQDGSSRRQPLLIPEESSRPRPRPKGVSLDVVLIRSRVSGGAPSQKRLKPSASEARPGKGKPLCSQLLNLDSPEDLWDRPELGEEVARHAIRKADLSYLQGCSAGEVMTSAFCDMARLPAAVYALGAKAEAYEEMQKRAEKFEEQSRVQAREISQLQLDRDSTRKQLEEELDNARKELKDELASGQGYLETLGGQRFLQEYGDKRISDFKNSVAFEEALEEASIPVFDECLTFCKERLINSGRFPGEDFEFLDPSRVEMIETLPSGDIAAAQASQGTCLLPSVQRMEVGDNEADP